MGAFKDLTGQRFNRLIALKPTRKDKWGEFIWECRCDCGNTTEVRGSSLNGGYIKSCGCFHKETARKLHYSHGHAGTRLYQIWRDIRRRCLNPNDKGYKFYGKKGISVWHEWKDDYLIFRKWALNNGYASNLTIDRINHKGKNNCKSYFNATYGYWGLYNN